MTFERIEELLEEYENATADTERYWGSNAILNSWKKAKSDLIDAIKEYGRNNEDEVKDENKSV